MACAYCICACYLLIRTGMYTCAHVCAPLPLLSLPRTACRGTRALSRQSPGAPTAGSWPAGVTTIPSECGTQPAARVWQHCRWAEGGAPLGLLLHWGAHAPVPPAAAAVFMVCAMLGMSYTRRVRAVYALCNCFSVPACTRVRMCVPHCPSPPSPASPPGALGLCHVSRLEPRRPAAGQREWRQDPPSVGRSQRRVCGNTGGGRRTGRRWACCCTGERMRLCRMQLLRCVWRVQ
jgi:hypothetical protein